MVRRPFLILALLLVCCTVAATALPELSLAGAAWAKDGEGGDDDDGGDDDSDDDSGDDDDDSGSGSDDDDDGGSGGGGSGSGGSGGSGSDDDDDSGSGGGGSGGGDDDDDGGSGSGGGSGGGSDDDDDDNGGSGSGSGGRGGSGNSGSGSAGRGSDDGSAAVGKRGKPSAKATANSDALPALKPGLRRLYTDGRQERISGGVIERLDPRGRVVERRSATAADRARLAQKKGQGLAAVIEVKKGSVTVTDRAGWREEFRGSNYRLIDPKGNLVTRRGVTRKDIAHLRKLLDLR